MTSSDLPKGLILTFFAVSASLAVQPVAAQSPADITKSWRLPQNALRVEWTESHFERRGARVNEAQVGPETGPSPIPTADWNYESRCSLVLEGDRMRTERTEPMHSGGTEFRECTKQCAYDGEECRSFWQYTGGDSQGQVHLDKKNTDTVYLALTPVVLACFPGHSLYSSVLDGDLILARRNTILNNKPHVILERTVPRTRHKLEYWVSVTEGNVISRCVRRSPAGVRSQVDISYLNDDRFGWRPSGWSVVRFDDKTSQLKSSFTAVVTAYDEPESLAVETFRIEFPRGMRIVDEVRGATYVTHPWFTEASIWIVGVVVSAAGLALWSSRRRRKHRSKGRGVAFN